MQDRTEYEYLTFLQEHRSNLALIARRTQGEHNLEDVKNEAWLLAHELRSKGLFIRFEEMSSRVLLLKHLYQRLVRYTDTHVRFAKRLEHGAGNDESSDEDPLSNRIASDPDAEPLRVLLAQESANSLPVPPSSESPASALIVLLRAFDNRMSRLADYLLISLSHCYRCFGKARRWAVSQRPLRAPVAGSEEELAPRPWRKFRIAGRARRVREDDGRQLRLI